MTVRWKYFSTEKNCKTIAELLPMLIKNWRCNKYFLRKSFQLSVYASKHCQIFARHVIWLPRRRLHWYWTNCSEHKYFRMLTQQHAWRCSNIFMNYDLFKMYCDTNQVTRSNAKYCFIANWDINSLTVPFKKWFKSNECRAFPWSF